MNESVTLKREGENLMDESLHLDSTSARDELNRIHARYEASEAIADFSDKAKSSSYRHSCAHRFPHQSRQSISHHLFTHVVVYEDQKPAEPPMSTSCSAIGCTGAPTMSKQGAGPPTT